MLYKTILKPIVFQFDAEKVHDLFMWIGQIMGNNSLGRFMINSVYGYHGPDISKTVDGIKYRTPIMLSAGFDYNAKLGRILPHIGFGGEEVGSVTARPCEGNKSPRLIRLKKSKSIIVNKGLKNDGVDTIMNRLEKIPREKDFIIGVNLARTNDQRSVPIKAGIEDFVYSFTRLNERNLGDYYTINISCPNAYGGESFSDPLLLDGLFRELAKVPCNKPVYVKMPINLPWEKFLAILKIVDRFGLRGVIIGNLNKNYNDLDFREEAPAYYVGGLSGKPCRDISTELIRKTRQVFGDRFTIIASGGVMSPEDAMEKLDAGADLIQLITGIIFEGPGLIKKMCGAYAKRMGK